MNAAIQQIASRPSGPWRAFSARARKGDTRTQLLHDVAAAMLAGTVTGLCAGLYDYVGLHIPIFVSFAIGCFLTPLLLNLVEWAQAGSLRDEAFHELVTSQVPWLAYAAFTGRWDSFAVVFILFVGHMMSWYRRFSHPAPRFDGTETLWVIDPTSHQAVPYVRGRRSGPRRRTDPPPEKRLDA